MQKWQLPALSSAQYESLKNKKICLFSVGADPNFLSVGKRIKDASEK